MSGRVDHFLPLTTQMLHTLLAVADGEKHGYAIIKEIARRTDDSVRIGAGTLYALIKRALADGLLVESDDRPDPALDDERRRYYRLTPLGRSVAEAEVVAARGDRRHGAGQEAAAAKGVAMTTPDRRSRSSRVFRALLRLLPFDFRLEHGREMEQVFRAQQTDARHEGTRRRRGAPLARDGARPADHCPAAARWRCCARTSATRCAR